VARAVLRDASGRRFRARVGPVTADSEFVIGKEKGGERRLARLAISRVNMPSGVRSAVVGPARVDE
jgi:hypothetical protein